MCKPHTLYCGDDGYIIYCNCCMRYYVAFLSLYLTFNEDDFRSFRHMIGHEYSQTDFKVKSFVRDIMVQTPAEGIGFIFSKYELKKFHEILEHADNEHKAIVLMGLFNP